MVYSTLYEKKNIRRSYPKMGTEACFKILLEKYPRNSPVGKGTGDLRVWFGT